MIEFTLNILPKTTNAGDRRHWAVKVREVASIHRLVHLAIRPHLPAKPHERVKLTLTRHSSSEPDYDGLVSSFKHVIDGLVRAGFLANDKRENIGVPEFRWERAKPKQGRVCVRIELQCNYTKHAAL